MKYSDKSNHYFNGSRPEMLKFFPKEFKTYLDIGCGRGGMIALIKESNTVEAWGIEYVEDQAKSAEEVADRVYFGAIEDNLDKLPDGYFDVISCLDVLEHLTYPEEVLRKIRSKLSPEGVIISSIPNVRHFSNMYNLLVRRDWKYEVTGILDYTHLRFFTSKSILRMYNNAGYEIIMNEGINPAKWWKYLIVNIFTLGMFNDGKYIQYATVAKAASQTKL